MSEPNNLTTVGAVIDVLGGNTVVQRATGVNTSQTVSQWRIRNLMPARLYNFMISGVQKRNCSAPKSLWGVVEGEWGDADDVAH
ncbi:hypothetical protein LJR231_001587 [Phyllobacterium sp. LjRoot231]|uniref:hypothetical protein n=1 Tax=Phyllobacterium sp. LjRoot231 TaxID=3342289 RepID=UPI003ECF6B83